MHDLLIVGAGPKAVAVGVRCAARREVGLPAPDVVAVDPLGFGGHWRAEGGWTDGRQPLGTSPEKDAGFPYDSGDAELDDAAFRYSWISHLRDAGAYDAWVDRGRPAPRHREWADYLGWAAERSGLPVVRAAVTRLAADDHAWAVSVDGPGEADVIRARAVMVTGPGPADRRLCDRPGVWSLGDFWSAPADSLADRVIVVIGSGESAASVVARSVRADAAEISIVAPSATVFSRGEGYLENRVYTHPEEWAGLDDEARRAIIERTDRGVFSPGCQRIGAEHSRLGFVRGMARSIVEGADGLQVRGEHGELLVPGADIVIDARGGDAAWFRDLLCDDAAGRLPGSSAEDIAMAIDSQCRVSGMEPPLYVPALAGFTQGPGFANLSCLGTLGGRIVEGVIAESAAQCA